MTRSVVPGDWYGVLGESVMVLLPPEAKGRVAGLWEAVDEGAGFDVVLDTLISGGLRGLPGFVLVSSEGDDVKVVIRGAGDAELTTADGTVTVSGSADSTWVERNASGVTRLRVRVADGEGAAYTVGPGLVRVASVEHPPAEAVAPAAGPAVAPEAEPSAAQEAEAVAVPIEPPSPSPRPARILPPDPQLQPAPPPEPPAGRPTSPPPPTPPVAPIPGAPVPVPGPLGVPAPDPLSDPLPETRRSDDGDDTEVDGFTPAHAADRPPAAPAVARLVFSSGDVVEVDRAIIVGRAPEPGRYTGEGPTRLVTVPSPHQEISSTHLEIHPGSGPDQGSAVVTDLGSTNGTVVVQPGLPAEDLRPGVGVQLLPGAIIDLGEGVTIQVSSV